MNKDFVITSDNKLYVSDENGVIFERIIDTNEIELELKLENKIEYLNNMIKDNNDTISNFNRILHKSFWENNGTYVFANGVFICTFSLFSLFDNNFSFIRFLTLYGLINLGEIYLINKRLRYENDLKDCIAGIYAENEEAKIMIEEYIKKLEVLKRDYVKTDYVESGYNNIDTFIILNNSENDRLDAAYNKGNSKVKKLEYK